MTAEKQDGSDRIRAVLFDFGGVLAEEGFREGLHAIATGQDLDPVATHRAGMDAVYDSGYVIGLGAESEFWNLMRQRTRIHGTDAELTAQILTRFKVRAWVLHLVRCLRVRGLVTAILSDHTDWLARLDARAHFLDEFDRVFVSYQMGKGKHDPTVFDDVLRALDLRPAQALFIDDASDNVERARSRGLRALLYTDRQRLEQALAPLLR
jgi:putative hydrolase of the HAD superfamily